MRSILPPPKKLVTIYIYYNIKSTESKYIHLVSIHEIMHDSYREAKGNGSGAIMIYLIQKKLAAAFHIM